MDLPADLELIHQPVRLRLMGLLYRHRDVAFVRVRDLLGLTDGNLATHAKRLEENGLLTSRRALAVDRFEVRYRITERGAALFRGYMAWLQAFVQETEGPDHPGLVNPSTSPTSAGVRTAGD